MVDKLPFDMFQISARSKASTPRRDHLIAALHQVINGHHPFCSMEGEARLLMLFL
jgi:hypothetical protein